MGSEVSTSKPRIGEMLIAAGLITQADLDAALAEQRESGERIVNVLMNRGALDSKAFIEFLAEPGSFVAVELRGMSIDPKVIALVSPDFALANEVVPVKQIGNTLTLAMMCPLDQSSVEMLESSTGCRVKPVLGSAEDVKAAVRRYYGAVNSDAKPRSVADPLTRDECWTALDYAFAVPALPETVDQIRAHFFRNSDDTEELAAALKTDPGMAAAMLREAHRLSQGMLSCVTIEAALEAIPPVRRYGIACAAPLSEDPEFRLYAEHAAAAGRFAEALAEALLDEKADWAFAAGLLHTAGRAMLARLGVEASPCPDIQSSLTGTDALSGVVGIHEATVRLLAQWEIPEVLGAAILYAGDPMSAPDEDFECTAIVHLAGRLATQWLREGGVNVDALTPCTQVLAMLGWAPQDVINWVHQADPAGMSLA